MIPNPPKPFTKIENQLSSNRKHKPHRLETMARQKTADKLESLLKQQAELTAKLGEAKAKADAEAREKQRRKNELAGAVALKELEINPDSAFAKSLLALLETGLTRAADRASFDLPPLSKQAKAAGSRAAPQAGGGSDVGNG